MGKFSQILTGYLPETRPFVSFSDDNLSKCQGILTKLGTCIAMNKIRFGIVNGKI